MTKMYFFIQRTRISEGVDRGGRGYGDRGGGKWGRRGREAGGRGGGKRGDRGREVCNDMGKELLLFDKKLIENCPKRYH